jgi:hypothetical protein
MADTVNTQVLRSGGRYYTVRLTNESDGTGETDVAKVDISTLTTLSGQIATHSAVDYITYSVFGMDHVVLEWDHTVNDEIAVLSGQGVIDLTPWGGKTDPQSAGGTGDIVLTTVGATSGGGYDLTLEVRPK